MDHAAQPFGQLLTQQLKESKGMAGTIDIRFDHQKHIWTAKPRFAHAAWGWDAPTAEGRSFYDAIANLTDKLPDEMANAVRMNTPRRIYRSPELIWVDDRCIDIDGHCPSREEYRQRRAAWELKQKFGRV